MTRNELARAAELRDLGIPLDGEVLAEMQAACRGLNVSQHPDPLQSSVFDLDSGGTGYMLSIAIDNDSERVIRGVTARLETPWWEPNFGWLIDPRRRTPREHTYSFPDSGPVGFEPEAILNHRLGRGTSLYPGDSLEACSLGSGLSRSQ